MYELDVKSDLAPELATQYTVNETDGLQNHGE